MFNLKNREFTFTVDASKLPCGLNGALYFVEMKQDGGKSSFPDNKAGANMGTGYCDAQCPHDDKFINGEANIVGWAPDPGGDPNSGDGKFGTCCTEMDIWFVARPQPPRETKKKNRMRAHPTKHSLLTGRPTPFPPR